MARISLVVCDVCESTTKGTSRWTIVEPNGTRKVIDLCDADAAPLAKLSGFTGSAPDAPAEAPRRGRPPRITVTPVEELTKK